MEIFKIVVTVVEVIASLLLIVVILLQSGKEAGLSGAISGKTETYLSKNRKGSWDWDKKLASLTKWIALVWILLTLALSLLP